MPPPDYINKSKVRKLKTYQNT